METTGGVRFSGVKRKMVAGVVKPNPNPKSVTNCMTRFSKMVEVAKLDAKPYQRDGVMWCLGKELCKDEHKGGIIADEMGLGKTITMIGTMVANPVKRTLIVLPVVLVEQWASQIKRITGHTALVYHGLQKSKITSEQLKASPIVLTTYGMITVEKILNNPKELHSLHWDRVVFDEAHHLRNNNTGRYIGAAMLNADVHWFMTGTPIQNKRGDLFSLCMLLGIDVADCVDHMDEIVEKYVLRRTKAQVGIKLPEVILESSSVAWADNREKQLAEEIHSALSFSGVDSTKFGKVAQHMTGIGQGKSFVMLIRARQMCTMPGLLAEPIQEMTAKGILARGDDYHRAVKETSKMDKVCDAILSRKGNGSGKLVFCNFRAEIDELAKRLRAGGIDKVATFDGRISGSKREEILKGKNEVIILQIQTGCEGLNLQDDFSEIYFSSPNWNPAIEDQAVARCHRIGQTKPVYVFRFVMDGFEKETISIETHIENAQGGKREIMLDSAPVADKENTHTHTHTV